MTKPGRWKRGPLEGLACLPWVAKLLSSQIKEAAADLQRGKPTVEELGHFAQIHQLGPLLFARTGLPHLQDVLPATLLERWQETYLRQWLANQRILRGVQPLLVASQCSGHALMLLKGPHLAHRFYGDLAQRKFEDIDLLVSKESAQEYLRWLQREFKFTGSMVLHGLRSRVSHAQALSAGDLRVDLHWALRTHPSFSIDDQRMWATRHKFQLPELGCDMGVLSDEYVLVLALLEIFDDVSRLEYSAKALIDAFLILRQVDGVWDWDSFLTRRRAEGIEGIVVDGLNLLMTVFKAAELLPELNSAVARKTLAAPLSLGILADRADRWRAVWSYRLRLYQISRPMALLNLLGSAPLRLMLT